MKQYFIGAGMVGAVALLILAGSARAEVSRGVGVVCKKQAEIEQIFDYAGKNPGSTGQQVLDSVNKTDKDCDITVMMMEKGKIVGHVSMGGTILDVAEIKVYARCSQGICIYLKPEDAYSVFKHEETSQNEEHF